MDEELEVRSRPDIRTDYTSNKERQTNAYMKVKETDYDKELELKRKNDPHRFEDPMKECTFKPEISYTGENNRRVKDLYEWEMNRKEKLGR